MTKDDILRMAREAGFALYDMHDVDGEDMGETVEADDWGALDRFAALVAAAEREACAKVCVEISKNYWMGDAQFEAATRCANAIRARSTQ